MRCRFEFQLLHIKTEIRSVPASNGSGNIDALLVAEHRKGTAFWPGHLEHSGRKKPLLCSTSYNDVIDQT
jgi:hypothetical protein